MNPFFVAKARKVTEKFFFIALLLKSEIAVNYSNLEITVPQTNANRETSVSIKNKMAIKPDLTKY